MPFHTTLVTLIFLYISTLALPSPPPLKNLNPSLSPVPLSLTKPLNTTSYCFNSPFVHGEPKEVDCHAAIVKILTSPDAYTPKKWSGNSQTAIAHWVNDTCSIDVQPDMPFSEDVFKLADVVISAALVVKDCVEKIRGRWGGWWSVGPKREFKVRVEYNHQIDEKG